MKDLIKILGKDLYNEKFDAAESIVYMSVMFIGMFLLMLLAGLLESITQ